MTDIVERLRARHPSWVPADIYQITDEAADQIERRDEEVKYWKAINNQHVAEIERLRAELKEVQEAWYGRCVIIDRRDDEIERLRAELA